jgi:serine/threonine protein kinase
MGDEDKRGAGQGASREPTELEIPLDQQPPRPDRASAVLAHASTQLPEPEPEPAPVLAKRTIAQWQPPASATQQASFAEGSISGERVRGAAGLGFAKTEAGVVAGAIPGAIPSVPGAIPSVPGAIPSVPGATMDVVSIPPPAPIEVGGTIGGRYVVEQHISSGGFGSVYRASDRQISNHQVAIKLLHNPAASDEERESALRELTLIASVSHPSVVQFKDYGWHDGRLWFAMPWYRGHTLGERLAGFAEPGVDPTPMKRTEAHPIFERLARGLAAMHEVGIYHHDIKPENVFLADIAGFSGGLPVLLDLGIAAKRGETPKGLTIEYAAPETAAAALGEPVGPIGAAADVFSLALVLRNALEPSTAPAMDADNALAILQRRAREPVLPPKSRDLRYLKPYFTRWLSLDPEQRPSAAELADQISVLIEPEERRIARGRLLRRLVPVVLIAAGLVAALWYQLEQQESELAQQREIITQEQSEREKIRRQSESQLKNLERRNATALGTERQRLEEAIGIARSLDGQLARSEREGDTLQRRVKNITDDRNQLAKEKVALMAERDELTRARDRLSGERDGLIAERNRLNAERSTLVAERDQLGKRADALARERDAIGSDLADRKSELSVAKSELKRVEDQLQSANAERKELSRRIDDVTKERDRIEAIRRSLERQLSSKGGGATPSEPAKPNDNRPIRPNPSAGSDTDGWR